MKDDAIIIARICDSAEKILRAVSVSDEAAFISIETTPAAVVLWLTQIGEMVKRLSENTKAQYDLPWRDISGFRDMAVHEYFELSLPDVYLTATKDIPHMLRILKNKPTE